MKGMILTLIPWLVELHPEQEIFTGGSKHQARVVLSNIRREMAHQPKRFKVEPKVLREESKKDGGLINRVKFRSEKTRGGKGYIHLPYKSINDRRFYEQHRRFRMTPSDTSDRPPRECYLKTPKRVELDKVFLAEKDYLLATVVKLKGHTRGNLVLNQVLDSIDQTLTEYEDNLTSIEQVHGFLLKHNQIAAAWAQISRCKENIDIEALIPEQVEGLRGALESEPNLLSYCGIHRSIMILVLAVLHPQLNSDDIQWLCRVARPWNLLQLGFTEKYQKGHITGLSQYDAPALWEDLAECASIRAALPERRESGVRFGVRFKLRKSPYDWIVIEDLDSEGRLLAGLFKKRDLDDIDDEIAWSESRLDVVRSNSLEIDATQIVKYLFQKGVMKDAEWFAYRWDERASKWTTEGILVCIKRGASSQVGLRGFAIHSGNADSVEELGTANELREFISRARDELARIKPQLEGVKHVRILLGVEGSDFKVDFIDSATKEVIHSIRIVSPVDLVRLLRWPLDEGRALGLRSGDRVTWDPLDHEDIDYGPLADLRTLVRTSKVDATTFDVPATLMALPFRIEVLHDDDLCPMMKDLGEKHGSCWRIRHSGVWPEHLVPGGGLDRGFSDKEVYDVLGLQGELGAQLRPDWKFVHGRDPCERIVYNTSKTLLKLLREKYDLDEPQFYSPERYRACKSRKWRVFLRVKDEEVLWEIRPTVEVTKSDVKNGVLEVDRECSIDEIVEAAMESLSKNVAPDDLADSTELRVRLERVLRTIHAPEEVDPIEKDLIDQEMRLVNEVLQSEDILDLTPSNWWLQVDDFKLLIEFYLDQKRNSEGIDYLERALKFIDDENISLMEKEKQIELLELKGKLYKGMEHHREMIGALSELVSIGETILRPNSKTEEIISRARKDLTLSESSND
jgi:hypothetical protein